MRAREAPDATPAGRAARWSLGLGASVMLHGGALAGLLWATAPRPVAVQPPPASQINLQSYAVPESRAEPTAPETETARPRAAEATALPQREIRQSRATADPLPQVATQAAETTGQTLRLSAPSAPTQAALPPSATPLATAALPSTLAAAASALPNAVVEAAPVPQPPSAAPLQPPSTHARAELAFDAAGAAAVDPLSVTAYQSFVAPQDAGAAATDLRDRLTTLLAAVPCARIQLNFDPATTTLTLTGHVPQPGAALPVMQALQAQMGQNIEVRDQLQILPPPLCSNLSGMAAVGLPPSTDQITNPLLLGDSTQTRSFHFTEGEALVLALQGADYDAYVQVDYFDAAGQVLHLAPAPGEGLSKTPAHAALTIGAPAPLPAGAPGLFIQIAPPFGQELAVAFASSSPIDTRNRPLSEPAGPYLDWLRQSITKARAADPDFKGEWVYFLVESTPR
ncbi:DUF4384 domain-containing protein [Phaeovulum sp. W22_SRMD_FR3]|uniref:DUF4384 domain-containing protein n=1 Tax=Phaeovulum sp. W22_SRMD_FR3 TaxID=3240274 RepID=UPI003F9771C1